MKKKVEKRKCRLCQEEIEIIWQPEGWGSTTHKCPKLAGASKMNEALTKEITK